MEINKDLIINNKDVSLDALSAIGIGETGTNLNDFVQEGSYFFNNAAAPLNRPAGTAGWLKVQGDGRKKSDTWRYIKQYWSPLSYPNEIYERTYNSGTWSSWNKFLTESDKNDLAIKIITYSKTMTDIQSQRPGWTTIPASVPSGYTLIGYIQNNNGFISQVQWSIISSATNGCSINFYYYGSETLSSCTFSVIGLYAKNVI